MFFSRKNATARYGVLLEIGSGSVAGAIVSSSATVEHPVILYSTRELLPLKQTYVVEDVNKRLLSAFLTVAMDVEAKVSKYIPKNAKLSSICMNFTAPWAHTRGTTHTYKIESPTLVTEKLLTKIKAASRKTKVSTSSTSADAEDFTLINQTITGYRANGYPTDNPAGQIVTTLTMTETVSAVNNKVFLPASDILKKLFNSTPVEYVTSSLLQQQLIQSQSKTPSTFATVHLTYEAIELTLYRNNEIMTAFTTHIGINTVARNIAQTSKLPHEQILSFLSAESTTYQEVTLSKIQKAFETSILEPLGDFFSLAQTTELLPRDFYLITTLMPSPAIINIITQALKKSSNNRFILHNLSTPIVHNTVNANLGSSDLGICNMAYFFHKNHA